MLVAWVPKAMHLEAGMVAVLDLPLTMETSLIPLGVVAVPVTFASEALL
jgi:hypothetical protein